MVSVTVLNSSVWGGCFSETQCVDGCTAGVYCSVGCWECTWQEWAWKAAAWEGKEAGEPGTDCIQEQPGAPGGRELLPRFRRPSPGFRGPAAPALNNPRSSSSQEAPSANLMGPSVPGNEAAVGRKGESSVQPR